MGAATEQEGGFSAEERAAMKERAAELKAEAKGGGRTAKKAAADEKACLEKIAKMDSPDRELAERIHSVVLEAAPELAPKVWYGQPAYARDGKVLCFFRSGIGDKERYSTFGFSPEAGLDEAAGFWPTSFAVAGLDADGEKALAALVKKAVG
ncbi:DUF1801 domain-containing protein [Zafaria sp. J156]|uniref:DUF1801 domain-containing protein n=1 Tax=Zafaria sp. J156 TaxID=3116490 RepID=UPI002E7A584C|nr:DUF1801 domain-containing protein [Zafaria sp. J156]MEE1621690.1 DUF1801 domain-containing protein [Zafaria sp. J156]